MPSNKKKNKIISAELTWEEKNSAVYAYHPTDTKELEKFVEKYQSRINAQNKKTKVFQKRSKDS